MKPQDDRITGAELVLNRGSKVGWWILWWATAWGCAAPSFFRWPGSEDDAGMKKPTSVAGKTVGDVTVVWGAHPVRVYGVGVVENLPGTGSSPPPGEIRRQAIHLLKQQGIEEPDKFLASGQAAAVVVTAVLMPGIRRGDPVDVAVQVPEKDRTTSLRGGLLRRCELYEYADARALRGGEGPAGAVRGHALAVARGPILVGLDGGDEPSSLRQGRIWNGGRSLIDRDFVLLLRREHQDARLAKLVADRINERFYGAVPGGGMKGMATAKNNVQIVLKVPLQYRLNWPRYLRVVRQIPLHQSPTQQIERQQQLARDLLDPAKCVVAALKLEALGTSAIPTLKEALAHEHPLVRFAAAEALAYLGEPAAAEVLAQSVADEPRFEAFGLAALASLDEAVSRVKLQELLHHASPTVRYGAFRALRYLDEHEPAVQGEFINNSFYLHCVAPDSPSLVHLTTLGRAEVILFGQDPVLLPPFSLEAGRDYLVTAQQDSDRCIVSHFAADSGVRREYSSLRVYDIVRTLGRLGASYPDIVDMLLQARRTQCLSCRLAIDALPESVSVKELAASAVDETLNQNPEEVESGLGTLPNLFLNPFQTRR
ncbi:MAG: flagellar basal body P-ring protein FlgI [Gemmatales bacterium]|nr:flagellar basal body P-ring protein FlgI [Gemmatales bacterium]MDW7995700.1 flagellar basal body P-ring protein FlgI [Gemmatales bacterium]